MRRVLDLLYLCVIVAISSSCNIDEEITTSLPPKIVLDSKTGIYTVKLGREIVISPGYESAADATYSWVMEGEVIGTEPSLTFLGERLGKHYISITVTTNSGIDRENIRVDVADLEIPTVTIASQKNRTITLGSTLHLVASLKETTLPTTLTWSVGDQSVGEGRTYSFTATELGKHTITATASNEDGTFSDSIEVEVINADDIPFEWEFERIAYHTVEGRKLHIAPMLIAGNENVTYEWKLDGAEESLGNDKDLVFVAPTAGEYHITATAVATKGENKMSLTREFDVTVYKEGDFYRPKSGNSLADWNEVYEYTPAPGQFINEYKTGGFKGTETTPEAAIAYAEARMSQRDSNGNPNPIWVSLGGFGGYIVVGFDHSIDNTGDYDLAILGNSFSSSSEPGIVWVMQDENGDGMPNDTWYELAGSETGKAETIQNYEVTYYRPTGTQMAVQWTDNLGGSGEVDYLIQFHQQDYYYPLWIEADSYTLRGTCLAPRNYDASGNGTYWVNAEYDWGYADNFSPVDREGEGDNSEANANTNRFKISNAIDMDGEPISLDFIDFVKVQCGVNAKSGWLGEVSTEVFGFYDNNMKR